MALSWTFSRWIRHPACDATVVICHTTATDIDRLCVGLSAYRWSVPDHNACKQCLYIDSTAGHSLTALASWTELHQSPAFLPRRLRHQSIWRWCLACKELSAAHTDRTSFQSQLSDLQHCTMQCCAVQQSMPHRTHAPLLAPPQPCSQTCTRNEGPLIHNCQSSL